MFRRISLRCRHSSVPEAFLSSLLTDDQPPSSSRRTRHTSHVTSHSPDDSSPLVHHPPDQTHRPAAGGKSPRDPLWRNGPDLSPVLSAHDGNNVATAGGAA